MFKNISTDRTSTFSLPRRRQQKTTDDSLQETHTHWKNPWRILCNTHLNENNLLVYDSCDSLVDKRMYLSGQRFQKKKQLRLRYTDTNASNNNPTPASTVSIPYTKGTSETIARILQAYTTSVLLTDPLPLHENCWLKLKKNLRTDMEQVTRSNAGNARPRSLVRPAGISTQEWLNANERQEFMTGDINTNIADYYLQINHRIDWDSAEYVTYSNRSY